MPGEQGGQVPPAARDDESPAVESGEHVGIPRLGDQSACCGAVDGGVAQLASVGVDTSVPLCCVADQPPQKVHASCIAKPWAIGMGRRLVPAVHQSQAGSYARLQPAADRSPVRHRLPHCWRARPETSAGCRKPAIESRACAGVGGGTNGCPSRSAAFVLLSLQDRPARTTTERAREMTRRGSRNRPLLQAAAMLLTAAATPCMC